MRCCQCQKELPDGVPFCKYCGARQTPQEAGEARKEAPQAETIQPVHQPAASPVVERKCPGLPRREKQRSRLSRLQREPRNVSQRISPWRPLHRRGKP